MSQPHKSIAFVRNASSLPAHAADWAQPGELQIQAKLGEGHVNIIDAKEVILTDKHLCLVMEYAAGNSLTGDSKTNPIYDRQSNSVSSHLLCSGNSLTNSNDAVSQFIGTYACVVQITCN